MKSKPVIAIDVDEVLFPFVETLSRHHNERFGTNLAVSDFHTYALEDVWGGSLAEAIEKIAYFHSIGGSSTGNPIEGAQQALKQLKDHYQLVVVSSRQSEFEPQTKRWIDEYFSGIFEEVYLTNHFSVDGSPHRSKADLCLHLEVEWLIDDSLSFTAEVAQEGIKTILFGDYPWNQTEDLSEGVRRAKDWIEVLEIVDAAG